MSEQCRDEANYAVCVGQFYSQSSFSMGPIAEGLTKEQAAVYRLAPELLALVKEARQYIELGASSAMRDGRSSDVGAVLNGLAERMRATIAQVRS